MSHPHRPISLLICALGGEGGGVLTEWLVDTARRAGYPVQATSVPGVAQRTGATTYYIEVFPVPLADLAGRRPVFSLNPVPGVLDALISSELLETARQVSNGMVSADRTRVITSSARTLTTQERMQLGDGRADSADLLRLVAAHSQEHQVLDMSAAAREAGTIVSAVMFGAIAASGLFPFSRADYLATLHESGGGAAASLRGFERAEALLLGLARQAAVVRDALADAGAAAASGSADPAAPQAPGLPADLAVRFPAPVHEVLALGHARVLEYQDRAYARLYIERMDAVLAAERLADPQGRFPISRETARWLALWMAFDDIVRVAGLKSAAARAARVRAEVNAAPGDLVRVYDHFKPGVPELAGLLPGSLAARLLAWDRRRITRGLAPWAMPLQIGSHGVIGLSALRALAAARPLRRLGSRYAAEQAMIGRWLEGVTSGTRRDAALGLEIARCGRLIKGYGTTNERGKENLLHVLDHLAGLPDANAASAAIASARESALADESGKALDQTLASLGAPARPVRAQPIRFVRRPAHQGKT